MEASRSRPSSRSSRPAGQSRRRERFDRSAVFYVPARFALLVLISMAPWWIASVSPRAQSVLLALSASSLIFCWLGILVAKRSPRGFPRVALPVVAGLILVGLQMAPLSTPVAGTIASHQKDLYSRYASPVDGEPVAASVADNLTDSGLTTRLSVHLDGTQQAFTLLVLGLTCLLLGAYLFSGRGAIWLLLLVAANGTAISVFGLVQKLNFNGKLFWVVPLIHGGIPFGPFVNRNNAAGYLLMTLGCSLALLYMAFHPSSSSGTRSRPIITREYPIWRRAWLHFLLFVSEMNAARFLSLAATTVIMVGVISTLSRGGAIALMVGLFFMFWTVGLHQRSGRYFWTVALCVTLVIGTAAVVGSNQSLRNRLNQLSNVDLLSTEKRVQHWLQTMPAVSDFAPLGSGAGSYVNVHRLYRADREDRIFFHAENHYFQTLVEAGPIGLVLLLVAIAVSAASVRAMIRYGRSQRVHALCFLGTFLLCSQSVAALTDFGLVIPANAVLMATLCGLLSGQASSLGERVRRKKIATLRAPRSVVALILFGVLAVTVVATVRSHRLTIAEEVTVTSPQLSSFRELDLASTERQILELGGMTQIQPSAAGYQRLAELWIHRYRLQLFDRLQAARAPQVLDSATLNQLWARTRLDQLHALVHLASTDSSEGVSRLRSDPIVEANLLPALSNLLEARSRSPLQPTIHLLLAQLQCLGGELSSYQFHLHRAKELAPASPIVFYVSGLLELQARNAEQAVANFRQTLLLSPQFLDRIVNASSAVFTPQQILAEIIPPNQPLLLHNFAKNHLSTESTQSLKVAVLTTVDELLKAEGPVSQKSLSIHAEVQIELGQTDEAVATLSRIVQQNPQSLIFRYRLGMAAITADQLEVARTQVGWFARTNPTHRLYRVLKNRYALALEKKAAERQEF